MEIVIEIPNELYDDYKTIPKTEIDDYGALIDRAIYYGTPLPKGHGRLIDADCLREDFKTSKKISFAERMDISCIVDHAPSIIEADRGKEE